MMDLYYPAAENRTCPAVIIVAGYPDPAIKNFWDANSRKRDHRFRGPHL
jgi:hypothetical protein